MAEKCVDVPLVIPWLVEGVSRSSPSARNPGGCTAEANIHCPETIALCRSVLCSALQASSSRRLAAANFTYAELGYPSLTVVRNVVEYNSFAQSPTEFDPT